MSKHKQHNWSSFDEDNDDAEDLSFSEDAFSICANNSRVKTESEEFKKKFKHCLSKKYYKKTLDDNCLISLKQEQRELKQKNKIGWNTVYNDLIKNIFFKNNVTNFKASLTTLKEIETRIDLIIDDNREEYYHKHQLRFNEKENLIPMILSKFNNSDSQNKTKNKSERWKAGTEKEESRSALNQKIFSNRRQRRSKTSITKFESSTKNSPTKLSGIKSKDLHTIQNYKHDTLKVSSKSTTMNNARFNNFAKQSVPIKKLNFKLFDNLSKIYENHNSANSSKDKVSNKDFSNKFMRSSTERKQTAVFSKKNFYINENALIHREDSNSSSDESNRRFSLKENKKDKNIINGSPINRRRTFFSNGVRRDKRKSLNFLPRRFSSLINISKTSSVNSTLLRPSINSIENAENNFDFKEQVSENTTKNNLYKTIKEIISDGSSLNKKILSNFHNKNDCLEDFRKQVCAYEKELLNLPSSLSYKFRTDPLLKEQYNNLYFEQYIEDINIVKIIRKYYFKDSLDQYSKNINKLNEIIQTYYKMK